MTALPTTDRRDPIQILDTAQARREEIATAARAVVDAMGALPLDESATMLKECSDAALDLYYDIEWAADQTAKHPL